MTSVNLFYAKDPFNQFLNIYLTFPGHVFRCCQMCEEGKRITARSEEETMVAKNDITSKYQLVLWL